MSTTNEALWEVEVEQTYADFITDEDEQRFRQRMARLGFDNEEIETHLGALKH